MIYEFTCTPCTKRFDVARRVSEYDLPASCPVCGIEAQRTPFPRKIHLYGTAVQNAYFHNGLGTVVRGETDAKAIAKERGLIEVGNEQVEKHVKPDLHDYAADDIWKGA